ncbi:hypothetical protein O6H91_01G116900 [Diphasiastrum complanatum]|nr:hypothetical protein O6H91_01G116900 [Diphasiastrum complanatum]
MVLNASLNLLTSIREVLGLLDLRALIVNNNQITTISRLDRLANLNTLVLSHNPIRELGKSFNKLSSLNKLSLSHCRLQVLGVSLKQCIALQELRLAHNQLMGLPKEFERNGQMRILDLGNNYVRAWSELQVLGTLHNLKNLNLKGNPIHDDNHYQESITSLLPNLEILDGHHVGAVYKKMPKQVGSTRSLKSSKLGKQFAFSSLEDPKRRLKDQTTDKPIVKKAKTVIEDDDGLADDDDTEKFMRLIVQTKAGKQPSEVQHKSTGRQSNDFSGQNPVADSGVVSAFDGNNRLNDNFRKIGTAFLKNYLEPEIGTGGPSTWETQVSSTSLAHRNSPPDEHRKQLSVLSARPSSYCRWKLKTSDASHKVL